MSQPKGNRDFSDLDRLNEEIIVDAYGENEQLSAFRQAFEDEVPMPADRLDPPNLGDGVQNILRMGLPGFVLG